MTITAPIPLSQQVFCDFLTKISKKRLFSKRITETGLIKKYKYLNSTFQRAPTAQCRRTVEEAAATTLTPFPREPSPGHSRASSQEQPPTSDLVSPSCNNRWRHRYGNNRSFSEPKEQSGRCRQKRDAPNVIFDCDAVNDVLFFVERFQSGKF